MVDRFPEPRRGRAEVSATQGEPRLAVAMVVRAITAGVPFVWVAADSVFGVGELEAALRRDGKGYVLGVNANHWFGSWSAESLVAGEAKDIAETLPAELWKRLSAGHGTKGEWLYAWAYCQLADLDAAENDAPVPTAYILAWSKFRCTHQAAARRSHLKSEKQL